MVWFQKVAKRWLVEVSGFFSFFGFLVEAENFIDDFDVAEKHASAAVAFDSEAVMDVAGVFTCFDPTGELVPLVADKFAAGKASYGDDHSLGLPVTLLFFGPCAGTAELL